MRYLSIKNFAKHQHYKDRRPPWIKLHVEVLDDYHFSCLQDASKAHLMLLWVLASKFDNRIPYDLPFLSKKLGATSAIDVEELVLQGFVEVSQDDSKPLAGRKRNAKPETEGEAEAKPEGESPSPTAPAFSLAAYIDVYTAQFPGAKVPGGRFGKVIKELEAMHGPEETLRRWEIFVAQKGKLGPEYFARTWSEWGGVATNAAPGPDPAAEAWDAVVAMVPAWQRREITAETHAALPEGVRRGLSKIGGFRVLAETPDARRVWLQKDFAAAFNQTKTQRSA